MATKPFSGIRTWALAALLAACGSPENDSGGGVHDIDGSIGGEADARPDTPDGRLPDPPDGRVPPPADAGPDLGRDPDAHRPDPDAGSDAGPDAGPVDPDAGPDAGPVDPDMGAPGCTPDSCAADEACAPSGECVARCRAGFCGEGFCGADGLCHDDGCRGDDVCPGGSFCDFDGTCIPGCRLDPDDCPAGQMCDNNHICVPREECVADEVCGNNLDDDCDGTVDDPDVCQAVCVPNRPCRTGQPGACADGLSFCPDGALGAPMCVAIRMPADDVCNGVDDDCDGRADEDFAGLGDVCEGGVGACAGSGRMVCNAAGDGVECGDFVVDPERCDGLDNDCDGEIDEAFPQLGLACPTGEGVCAAEGVFRCAPDGAGVLCDGAAGQPGVEVCNGLDDDCDGETDEEWPDVGQRCNVGQGACGGAGIVVCAADGGTRCNAQVGAPGPEVCNGRDDDCDGLTDEGADGQPLARDCYEGPAGTQGIGLCRGGRSVCANGAYGECAGQVLPAAETCNNQDEDCNGRADDGPDGGALRVACYDGRQGSAGVGVCRPGTAACIAGRMSPCEGQTVPALEICDGADNDCNGQSDEVAGGCACRPGEERACYGGARGTENVGVCRGGRQVCAADGSGWGPCIGQITPSSEICNALDDNCNGVADDSLLGVGVQCTAGLGECVVQGRIRCEPEGRGYFCDATPREPGVEACNNRDDDCDGLLDEDFGIGEVCERGTGACRREGVTRCGAGGVPSCAAVPGQGSPETCNAIDDDCDGATDETFTVGDACSVGVGACRAPGREVCAAAQATACDAEPFPGGAETCDFLDNDCDGETDEGFRLGEPCQIGVGACQRAGRIACAGDGGTFCDAPPFIGSAEQCNGADDDCDGRTDESIPVGRACQSGQEGVCADGRFRCVDGRQQCIPELRPSPEICDGLDNDCDGTPDDGLQVVVCGQGICRRELGACQGGEPLHCDPFEGAEDFERCNGLDDDCDGRVDEQAIGDNAFCERGVGACQRVGRSRCVDGRLTCDAVAGQPSPELCDGRDNDCDGQVDDGALGVGDGCFVGVGGCRVDGALVCADGELACPGEAREPGAEVCNGIDDDCDGLLDEGFGSVVCGVGACRHAVPSCNGGAAPACNPMEGATPEICNGIDDDCDGVVDDDVRDLGQRCRGGVGACERPGTTVCRGGQVTCDVVPGQPAAETCDLVDNDCDGEVDEQTREAGRVCQSGVGACLTDGVTTCEGGAVRCDAVPGRPAPEACNGVDDNCNGETDEGFGSVTCGEGQCRHTVLSCRVGGPAPACDPMEGAGQEVCDAVDNDCDGQVDDAPIDVGARCEAGVGACRRVGVTVCREGGEVCGVQPGPPAPEQCNGVDDDCDGSTDEGNVCPDRVPPTITVGLDREVVDVGATVTVTVTARDDRGVVQGLALRVDGAPVALDGNGQARYAVAAAGVHEFVATARDAAGNEGRGEARLRALEPADVSAPVVQILSPAANAVLTEKFTVTGSVQDANLFGYELSYARMNTQDFVTVSRGDAPGPNGELGTMDPTLLQNGMYKVRLVAEDINGRRSVAERTLKIEGENKIGHFRLTFVDLSVPVAGMPITIERTYDSRRRVPGDFGTGWTLDVRQGRVEHNVTPGASWQMVQGGFLRLPCQAALEGEPHLTDVHVSERERYSFRMRVTPGGIILGGCQTFVSYEFVAGTMPGRARLDLLDGDSGFYFTGLDYMSKDIDDPDPFDVNRVRLTTPDGRVFDMNLNSTSRVQEPSGNAITIDAAGIRHTAGPGVQFQRDARGRITAIIDPAGNALRYTYDAEGNLTQSADRTNAATRYTYLPGSVLDRIIDPNGRTPARQIYDDDGRLVAIIDASGRRVEMNHDPNNRVETVVDRLGNLDVYEYDAKGNILTHTTPLGGVWRQTFDDRNNRLSRTDPEGNTTRWTYDAENRQTSEILPSGATKRWTYNARAQILTETNADGAVLRNEYDAAGRKLSTTSPTGAVTRYTYNARNLLETQTDPDGGVTRWTYNNEGRIATETSPVGTVKRFTYDANGNQVTETIAWTGPDGRVQDLVWRHEYDAEGRETAATDPLGHVTRFEYDPVGNKIAEVDALGRRKRFEHDEQHRLLRTTFADGTAEVNEYDAKGRRTSRTDRTGRTTRYQYGFAGVSEPMRVIFPDGGQVTNDFDDAGRIAATADRQGGVTRNTYDVDSRLVATTDALGRVTRYTYNARGDTTSVTGPDGRTTRFEYDAAGRRTAVVYPDGSRATTEYDGMGRKLVETDQAGRETRFEYDLAGRPLRVFDALDGETTYDYDELGNLVAQTDANGHTTEFEYDALGRRTATVRPNGDRDRTVYDAVGNISEYTDFEGRTTRYTRDTDGRPTRVESPDGSVETTTWDAEGRRLTHTDARGTTRWTWDPVGRLASVTDPDGVQVRYTYDAAGKRTSVTGPNGRTSYANDAIGRLVRITDPEGGVTRYTYDAAGNRETIVYANGVTTRFTYDALQRLTRVETRNAANAVVSAYDYTLGPTGNRTRVVEGHSGRTVDYTYDALYRLTREQITDAHNGNRTIAYTYDPVGNRLTRTDSVDGHTAYEYDENDRLVRENDVTYTYDRNGNLRERIDGGQRTTYTFDTRNRLLMAEAPEGTVEYEYDGLGNRVAMYAGDTTTRFVVDTQGQLAQVLAELDADGTPRVTYVHGSELISQRRDADTLYHIVDGLLSTRQLVDARADVSDTWDFDAFGFTLNRTGDTDNHHLFTGEYLDANTGFYYLRARWMNPDQGRFVSADAVHGNLYDPRTLHKYTYALNNPVNLTDPSGQFSLASLSVSVGIGQILSGILPTLFTGLYMIIAIKYLMEPGFNLRYAAMEIIPNCPNAEICEFGQHLYQTGALLIQAASQFIQLAKAMFELGTAGISLANGINSLLGASGKAKTAIDTINLLNSLYEMNGKIGSLESALGDAVAGMGGDRSKIRLPHVQAKLGTAGSISKSIFLTALKIVKAGL